MTAQDITKEEEAAILAVVSGRFLLIMDNETGVNDGRFQSFNVL